MHRALPQLARDRKAVHHRAVSIERVVGDDYDRAVARLHTGSQLQFAFPFPHGTLRVLVYAVKIVYVFHLCLFLLYY